MKDLTDEELENLKAEKEAYAGIWKQCTDGSYGMALSMCRYYEVLEEINKRKTNETISSRNKREDSQGR